MKATTLSLCFSFIAASSILHSALLEENFEQSTFPSQSTIQLNAYAGAQSGDARWDIARSGSDAGSQVAWGVNTSLGWTANDGGGNQYLFADGTNTDNNTVFRSSGWNASSEEILKISFTFATLPEDDGNDNNNWGALVMSANTGLGLDATTVPGASDQQVHIRFNKEGDVAFQDDTLIGSGGEFVTGLDQLNTLELTYNGSASIFNGIASGNASLTVNGSLVVGNFDVGHVNNSDGAVVLNYFELRSFGGLGQPSGSSYSGSGNPYQAAFDDISITAVPEPSAFALIAGIGALAYLTIRRRLGNR